MTRPSGYERNGWQWARTVARTIERDRGICYLCGNPGADTADHVIPISQHGSHRDDNLAAAHRHPCHADKTERERLHGIAKRVRQRPTRRHPNLLP